MRLSYKQALCLLPFFMILQGCAIQLEDFPDHGGDPIIYGALSTESQSFVIIQAINGFEKNVEANQFISEAKVVVHLGSTGEVIVAMKETRPGYYILEAGNSYLEQDTSYWIDIQLTDGHNITSKNITIPHGINIQSIALDTVLFKTSDQMPFKIEYNCPGTNPYLKMSFLYVADGEASRSMNSLVPEFAGSFSHQCQESEIQQLRTHFGWFFKESTIDQFLERFDRFSIRLSVVTKDIHQFKAHLSLVDFLEGGDEYFEPVLLYSNLTGALGVIGAYQSDNFQLK